MKLINRKGFTMLEMMIVIFVFLTGIVGAYGIINNFYVTSVYSSNRFTATYLSQEGIELIKNLRDNNLITEVPWTTNIDCSETCQIDYDDSELFLYQNLYLQRSTDGFYNHGSGVPTIFKRKITTEKVNINGVLDHINVKVETEWYKNGVKNGSAIIESQLYEYWQ